MKVLTGKIISTKMKNTVVVEVIRFVEHPMYKKRMRRTKKFHAHTLNEHVVGEIVKISEVSPISKTKSWIVTENTKKHATT